MNRARALAAYNRQPTDRIPHCEFYSNPDALTLITGIDGYKQPLSAELALLRKHNVDVWWPAASDEPLEHPDDGNVLTDADGRQSARWGAGRTWHWDWGTRFKTIEDVLKFDPLADMDYRWMEPVGLDLSVSVEELTTLFQKQVDEQRAVLGDLALAPAGFYNTLFMWLLLNFGWELLIELAMEHPSECERMIRDFACVSRKVFKAWANTDVEAFHSHDDICFQMGPTFAPAWLHKHMYPYYEEFWGYLKTAGKKVVFICDGNLDQVLDDIIACGADGSFMEVYTDARKYKSKHPNGILIGGGDNRILSTEDPVAIEKMVLDMTDLGRDMPGYFYSVSNHLTWDLPPKSVQLYFELCDKYGKR